ncbi:MAG: hypothetical protein NTX82_06155 [Candidatus Parcubacteria bacterium]|nr:hypothetical protein [Candidatus Parcubacteria bacterium]
MAFEELLTAEKHKNLEINDLEQLRTGLLDDADYLYERYAEKKITWPEYTDLVQQLHGNLIENLIRDQEKLAKIFQTENGSYYFILQSGHCLRIKKGDKGLHSEPITDNVFFVAAKTGQEILDQYDKYGTPGIVDKEIKLTNYQIGARPLEIGLHNYAQSPVIDNRGSAIIILGAKLKGSNEVIKQVACGMHVGHEITEIIK